MPRQWPGGWVFWAEWRAQARCCANLSFARERRKVRIASPQKGIVMRLVSRSRSGDGRVACGVPEFGKLETRRHGGSGAVDRRRWRRRGGCPTCCACHAARGGKSESPSDGSFAVHGGASRPLGNADTASWKLAATWEGDSARWKLAATGDGGFISRWKNRVTGNGRLRTTFFLNAARG